MAEPDDKDLEQRVARLERQLLERPAWSAPAVAPATPVDPAPAPSPPPAAPRRRDWDAYAAVVASLIGLLALGVSGYTAHVQRQQLRAQVWPHVRLRLADVPPMFGLINEGTGPARVTAMRVTVRGAPVRTWWDVKAALGYPPNRGLLTVGITDAVIPAGKEIELLRPETPQDAPTFLHLMPGHPRALSIMICYCSVLDDCYVATLGIPFVADGNEPAACPIRDEEAFQGVPLMLPVDTHTGTD